MLTEEQVQKYEHIYNTLTDQIAEYLLKNNLKTMVLGISGGIDSTVCAALCYGAMKKSNYTISTYGVMLPSVTNAIIENEAADEVMKAFCPMYGINFIDNAVNALEELCANVPADSTKLAVGNIKARTRMIYLYHAAQLLKGVVIGASNKSEAMLGFYTLHGTDVNDMAPIMTLYKHNVYEFAEYIKDYICETGNQKHAIGLSIALTPTDGNGVLPGGDMNQIAPGYTYNDVDIILELIEKYQYLPIKQLTQKLITEITIDINTIKSVIKRYNSNKFKNNLPIQFHI